MKGIIFLGFFVLFLAGWGFAQADLQPAAIVNLTKTEPITVRQFRTEVERMEKSTGRTLNEKERREVLDVMINERLAMQAAERDKVTITDNEVNQHLGQLRAQMSQVLGRQPTEAEFATAVKNESGLEVPAFRDQVRRNLIVQKYLMSQKQSTLQNVKPPAEGDITREFNLARSEFVRPDTVRFSMIQVLFGADAAARTKARDQINNIAKEIGGNPSRFDEVVLRGQSANSTYQAGDFGFLPKRRDAMQVVGEGLFNAAFALKQGEVSAVIEGQMGYQIIKITETYTMKNLDLDDIYQLGTRITVREFIGNALLQRQQMEMLNKASQELVAELRAGKTVQIFERNLSW
jgi:parvulin-like peptidyl-prolyl isomerase